MIVESPGPARNGRHQGNSRARSWAIGEAGRPESALKFVFLGNAAFDLLAKLPKVKRAL